MSMFRMSIRQKARLGAGGILVAGLCWLSLAAPVAHAAIGACRTDPILQLSNGATLSVIVNLPTTAASDVAGITYVVSVPGGVTTTNLSIPGALASVEHVQVVSGGEGYSVTALITTADHAQASAAVTMNLQRDDSSSSTTVLGLTDAPISIGEFQNH